MAPKKKTAPKSTAPVFIRQPIYQEFRMELANAPEGSEPLTAKVQVNIPFLQLDAIPRGNEATFQDIFEGIARYVGEWNLTAEDLETGKVEPVPPPAEAGWEVLQCLDHMQAIWLIDKVRYGYLRPVQLKAVPDIDVAADPPEEGAA